MLSAERPSFSSHSISYGKRTSSVNFRDSSRSTLCSRIRAKFVLVDDTEPTYPPPRQPPQPFFAANLILYSRNMPPTRLLARAFLHRIRKIARVTVDLQVERESAHATSRSRRENLRVSVLFVVAGCALLLRGAGDAAGAWSRCTRSRS